MHDVTKRGLALAVATGGLLITGAAPALSAVSTHPENPDHAGKKSQPTGASSHHAAIPVSAPQVKQYTGRHKTNKADRADKAAAAPHHAAALHDGTPHPTDAPHHPAAQHHATAAHHAAPHHATAPHHPAAAHYAAPQHAAAPHHTAPHHAAPHHAAAPHHPARHDGAPAHAAPGMWPAAGSTSARDYGHDELNGAQAQSVDFGSPGLLTGNSIEVPVDAPVNICGLVVTVLGGGDSAEGNHCVNGPGTAGGPTSSASAVAHGSPGALSNNVVQVPVSLPANICGDTVTAVGGNDSAEDVLCANEGAPTSSTARAVATDSPGLASGNVVQVPVDAPLNLCGITANVVGVYDTAAGNTCVNGGHVHEHGHEYDHGYGHEPMHRSTDAPDAYGQSLGAGAQAATANSSGAVTGNIVQVPIEAPLNACGDSVSVVGVFNSALDNHCVNDTAGGAGALGRASGDNGLAAGNVAQLPIDIPTEVCGVVAAVGGYHDTAAGNTCVNTGATGTVSSANTAGETGIVTGNVAQGSVNAPIEICGTTIGAGYANSGTEGNGCFNGPPPPPVNCAPPPCPPPVYCPPPPCTPPPPPHFPPPPPPPSHHHHHHEEHLHRHHHRGPHHHEEMGRLPHTGTDVLDYAGLAAGALVLGAGAVFAGRRKSGSAN
jgi:LPXTG-motif cell wall-anchored protein